MRHWIPGILVAGLTVLTVGLRAQAPAVPSFEVASVRPNASRSPSSTSGFNPPTTGNYTAVNVTLSALIRDAYRVRDFQVAGGLEWVNRDRFDVITKAPGEFPPETAADGTLIGASRQLSLLLQHLLADRFRLRVHLEERQRTGYALVPAHADGKLGPSIRRTATNCDAVLKAVTEDRTTPIPRGPDGKIGACFVAKARKGQFMGWGLTIANVIRMTLASAVDSTIIDRTGLTGYFDLELEWNPEPTSAPANGAPSILVAVQEQLGLKIESERQRVDVLVVDSAERPTEN